MILLALTLGVSGASVRCVVFSASMLPERATTDDYNAIIDSLADYWGERDMRARHHPMFIHEFGDTALVMRDGSGSVAAYLFGFIAPTRVGYVHLVGVRADSRRAGLGRRLYDEFETLARDLQVGERFGVAAVQCDDPAPHP